MAKRSLEDIGIAAIIAAQQAQQANQDVASVITLKSDRRNLDDYFINHNTVARINGKNKHVEYFVTPDGKVTEQLVDDDIDEGYNQQLADVKKDAIRKYLGVNSVTPNRGNQLDKADARKAEIAKADERVNKQFGAKSWGEFALREAEGAAVAGAIAALGSIAGIPQATLKALEIYFAYEGAKNLTSDNGFRKTINLALNKDFNGAAKSFTGDILDAMMVGSGYKAVKGLYDTAPIGLRLLQQEAKTAYTKPRSSLGDKSIRSVLKPFTGKFKTLDAYDRINAHKKYVEEYLKQEYPNADINLSGLPSITIKNGELNSKAPISFYDPINDITSVGKKNINTTSEIQYSPSIGDTFDLTKFNIDTSVPSIHESSGLEQPIQRYADSVKGIVGDDALIGGSTFTYGKGYAVGTPNDLELVSTQARLPALRQKLQSRSIKPHGDFGEDITSPFGVNGEPITVQTINEIDGKATGPLALEYYKILHPKEYNSLVTEMIERSATSGVPESVRNLKLPISAEALYKEITPEIQETKLLKDMFLSDKPKHVDRAYQALTNSNPVVRQQARVQMQKALKSHFGDDFKLASENYPNLKFNNIEDNKRFLRELDLPETFASDEEVMKSLIDRYHYSKTTQSRGVSIYDSDINRWLYNTKDVNKALQTIYAPKGGHYAGIGGNTVVESGRGGFDGDFTGIMSQKLTMRPENITKPTDIIKAYNRLSNSRHGVIGKDDLSKVYQKLDKLENDMRAGIISEEEGIKLHEQIAQDSDFPYYPGSEYSNRGYYAGNNIRPTIGSITPVAQDNYGLGLEVGGSGIPRKTVSTNYDKVLDPSVPWESRPEVVDYYNRYNAHKAAGKGLWFERPPKKPVNTEEDIKILNDLKTSYMYIDDVDNSKEFNAWTHRIDKVNKSIRKANKRKDNIKAATAALVAGGVIGTPLIYFTNKSRKIRKPIEEEEKRSKSKRKELGGNY